MIEPIKNAVNRQNLLKVTQNEEVRRVGRAARHAAAHAGREFAKAFAQAYKQEREKR